jgi:GTP-dependent dephospho-CoA kinase
LKAGTSPRPSAGDRILTPYLRRKLKKPLGRLFRSVDVRGDEFLALASGASLVIAVGDRVTETLQETTGRPPDVFVIDGRERRAPREIPRVAHGSTLRAKNPAGCVTRSARSAIRRAFSSEKPVMVLIDGEEDLLAIPAVIEAPLGAVVFYGQPLEGVVAVEVDEISKENARGLLRRMSSRFPIGKASSASSDSAPLKARGEPKLARGTSDGAKRL